MWSAFVFIVAAILNALIVFLQGFFVVMFGDLEIDYINPIDLCNKLNPYILPEAALQAFIAVFLLLTGHWFSFLLNLPVLVYNALLVYNNQYLLDATEIFKTLKKNKTTAFAKLVVHVLLFFYYLFNLIVSLLGWED